MATTLMMSCNGIKGTNGKTYTDYKEACKDHEFDVAHKIADAQFEAKGEDYSYRKACEYIFDAESLFLIEQGDEESADRIFILLEEFNRKFRYAVLMSGKVLSTAMALDNIYLVKKIAFNKNYNDILICQNFEGLRLDMVIQYLLEQDEIDAAYKILLERINFNNPMRIVEVCNEGCRVLLDYALENGNLAYAEKVLERIVVPPNDDKTRQFYNDAKKKFDNYRKAGKLK